MEFGMMKVPCKYCGTPTMMVGTRMCDYCWELETRVMRAVPLAAQILFTCRPRLFLAVRNSEDGLKFLGVCVLEATAQELCLKDWRAVRGVEGSLEWAVGYEEDNRIMQADTETGLYEVYPLIGIGS